MTEPLLLTAASALAIWTTQRYIREHTRLRMTQRMLQNTQAITCSLGLDNDQLRRAIRFALGDLLPADTEAALKRALAKSEDTFEITLVKEPK